MEGWNFKECTTVFKLRQFSRCSTAEQKLKKEKNYLQPVGSSCRGEEAVPWDFTDSAVDRGADDSFVHLPPPTTHPLFPSSHDLFAPRQETHPLTPFLPRRRLARRQRVLGAWDEDADAKI